MTTIDEIRFNANNSKCRRCNEIKPIAPRFKVEYTDKDAFKVKHKIKALVCENCYMDLTKGNTILMVED